MKNKHKAIAAAGIAAAAAGVIGHRVAAARQARADADTLRQAYESLNGQERLTDPGNYFQAVALPADIQVRLLTARQAANMSEGTVFFGFPTCPWCRNALPLALEAAAGAGCTLCYCPLDEYRDVYALEDDALVEKTPAGPGYHALLARLGDCLEPYTLTDSRGNAVPIGEKRIFAPTIARFHNGALTNFWTLEAIGFQLPEGQSKYAPWTGEQKAMVRETLQKMF